VALGKVQYGADETITCLIVYEFKKMDKTSKTRKKSEIRMRKFGVILEEICRKETQFSNDTSIEFSFKFDDVNQFIFFNSKKMFCYNYNTNGSQE
jgi:hypothetical protein